MRRQIRWMVFPALALLAALYASPAPAAAGDTLLNDVLSLKLGMGGYEIGRKLTAAQKKIGVTHPEKGAYEGTCKFVDNGLHVVADKKTDRVLALYKQIKEADRKQLKDMVVELMGLFNAPTTMAHDTKLYWAFNKYGAVTEQDFNRARETKQTSALGIIATVKLNSEMKITPDPEDENGAEAKEDPATGLVYCILTSDPLVQQFMTAQK